MVVKVITFYAINKIKKMQGRIFEILDTGDGRGVKACERSIERALDEAGISDPAEREEALGLIVWYADDCASCLRARGWEVVASGPHGSRKAVGRASYPRNM